MKKLLFALSFSLIALSNWSQVSNACFSSRNDFSFSRPFSQSRGITKGDFDNDGNLDVVTTAYATGTQKRFYFQKGLGNGKFGTAIGYCTSGNQPQDIKSADFNNDGNLDIAFANQIGVYIYYGQGNGIFDSITSLTLAAGKYLALGDFDEDGAIDIVVTASAPTTQFTLFRGTVGNPTLFTSTSFNIGTTIVNMEVADMDGDNHLDVVSYTTGGIYISRNNNGSLGNFFTGTSIPTSGTNAADLTLCDIDNDGDIDVIASNKGSHNISVMKNNGAGNLTFHAIYATETGPDGIENFDINQDGFKDIVVTNMGASTLSIFFGSSGGILSLHQTTQAAGNPRALVVGQFSADTYADIVTAQNSGPYINSFIGNASHNYLQTNLFEIAASPSSAFAADFNGDGNQDVAITHSTSNSVQIYLGNGAGNFTAGATLVTGINPVHIIGADLNNNGSMDLVVVNSGSNNISIFYGSGSGTFSAGTTHSVGTTPAQAKIGHLNGDAFLDIVVSNSGSSNFSALLASGGTSFNAAANYSTNATPYAILITDYDSDGFNDVIVGHNQATNTALLLRYQGNGTGTLTANANVGFPSIASAYFSTTALEAADLDGDGDHDIIVGKSGDIGKTAFPGTNTGNATGNTPGIMNATLIPGVAGAINGIKIVDVNNDGKLDVLGIFNNGSSVVGTLTVAVATGFGTDAGYVLTAPAFGFATEIDASGLAVADFNNDGRVDVIVPNRASNSFTLHLNTTPIITAGGPTTFCSGNNVTLTSTAASQWYNWNPTNEVTQAISATSTGIYSVTTSSSWSDWCQAKSDTIAVTVTPGPTAPTISAGGPTTFCSGGNVTLTSSQATGNQWYKDNVLIPGATNQTYLATTAGVYTATYSSGGCTSDQSGGITVTTSATPIITADGPTTFCTGGSVVLTSDVTSNILWSNGATTPSITVTSSGNYSVQNIVGGCATLTSNIITVTVAASLSAPTISPAGPVTLCPSGTVTLTSSSPTNNIWSNGATTQSISVSSAGSYFVHLNNGTCSSPNSATVSVTMGSTPATPIITAGGPTTFCAGGSVTLTSSAGTSYLWSTGATTQSINVTTTGSYTVQVTNAAGCQSAVSSPTAVTVNALPAAPIITAGGPTTFCAGGSVTLTSSAGTSYLWSTGETTQSINVTTAGSYTVQITNASTCQSTASAATVVTVNALPAAPIITASGPTTFCAGGSVTLTSSAGMSYLWSTGETTQSINVTTSGSYTVQITNASACQSTASAATVVTVDALPAAPIITPEVQQRSVQVAL